MVFQMVTRFASYSRTIINREHVFAPSPSCTQRLGEGLGLRFRCKCDKTNPFSTAITATTATFGSLISPLLLYVPLIVVDDKSGKQNNPLGHKIPFCHRSLYFD
jgi:hypothetical protein